jgi:nitrite reductase/ring-hydroxylating ferredoxin subunit/uncharacterized membrane protein
MNPDTIATTIEEASFLDKPATAASNAIHKLIPAGPVKDLLSGTPLGHPAHPMLVTVPIGAWVSASLLDAFGGSEARTAARRLVGFGTLIALPTALTGASDWSDTMGPERRVGLVHAATNYTAISLYAASWIARRRGRHASGVRRAVLGAVVASVGGWLGGHLTYAAGVGVDTTAFLGAPTEWTDVLAESELPDGQLVAATVGVVPLMILRRGDHVVALGDRCTHRGAPLHEGELTDGGNRVVCPWHDSCFDTTTGEVIQGPATRPQPRFEVRIEQGRVQVRQGAEPYALRTNPVATI